MILYIGALLCLFIFGGTIKTTTDFASVGAPTNYNLLHSNDLLASMLHLYVYMVGNNWFVARDIYTIKNPKLGRWFFNIWFAFCDMILMNILKR